MKLVSVARRKNYILSADFTNGDMDWWEIVPYFREARFYLPEDIKPLANPRVIRH